MTAKARRGANAVEFAIIAPVLVALLTGMVDYCWVLMLRDGAGWAAREGARAGSVVDSAGGTPEQRAAQRAWECWNALNLGGDPTIEAFRAGTPELIVVRIQLPVSNTIGFVATPKSLEVVASELVDLP